MRVELVGAPQILQGFVGPIAIQRMGEEEAFACIAPRLRGIDFDRTFGSGQLP